MPVNANLDDLVDGTPSLQLMRLNFEYMLTICPEHTLTDSVKDRLDEIEREVISIFWRTPADIKKEMSGLFRAFIAMRKSYRSI